MANEENQKPVAAAKNDSKSPQKRRRRWPLLIVGAFFAIFILGSVGFVGATLLEEQDPFCGACHTVPETTYIGRATTAVANTNAPIADLATMHYHMTQANGQSFACINCHRGDSSLLGRVQTLTLGARDTAIFVSGKSDPTLEKSTITDPLLVNAACVSCHTDTLLKVNGNQTHFHNWLPQTAVLVAQGQQLVSTGSGGRNRRLRTVATTVTCTSCHLAHKTVDTSDPRLKLVDKTFTQNACDTCHRDAGERPQSIDRLLSGEEG